MLGTGDVRFGEVRGRSGGFRSLFLKSQNTHKPKGDGNFRSHSSEIQVCE